MVYGYNRIPIVSWLKDNAQEGLDHAHKAGELVTLLGGHPSLKIGALLETENHDIRDLLRESLEHEKTALAAYYDLLKIAEGKSVLLEEYAREMIGMFPRFNLWRKKDITCLSPQQTERSVQPVR
jgi:bacterioferritin